MSGERIARRELDARALRVTNQLRAELRVEASGRNGYVALDLYDGVDAVRTLTVGTTREVHEYLGAMAETLAIQRGAS